MKSILCLLKRVVKPSQVYDEDSLAIKISISVHHTFILVRSEEKTKT